MKYAIVLLVAAACHSSGDDINADGSTPATANFFVATNGSDGWSGTLPDPGTNDGPFATIGAAQIAVRAYAAAHPGEPVTVLVRGGTYALAQTLVFTAADSGTASGPITWGAYPGEAPVLSGGIAIAKWTDAGNNRWTAPIDAAQFTATPDTTKYGFEQLFVDDVRHLRARARASYQRLDPIQQPTQDANCEAPTGQGGYYCANRFAVKAADQAMWAALALSPEVEVDVFEKWTMAKMRVQSYAAGTVTLTGTMFQSPNAQSHNQGALPNHRYLVENVKSALGAPGSWYLDTGAWQLTYVAAAGEDPRSETIIAPRLPTLLTATDLAYVTFSGLAFEHDNFVVPEAGVAEQQASPGIPAAVSFVDTHDVTIDHVTLAHIGAWGLEFVADDARSGASHDNVVTAATAYDVGAGAIRIGQMVRQNDTDDHVPQHNRVENSIVAGFGRTIPNGVGVGIWVGDSHDNVVTHNEVYDSYNGGIGVCVPTAANCRGSANSGGAFNNEISGNLVHDMGQGVTDDMGCIYVATEAATGNKVLGNVCHDVTEATDDTDGYGGNGIYLDNSTHGVEVAQNLVYRVTMSALINNHGSQTPTDVPNDVHDNILAFAMVGGVQRTLEGQNAMHFIKFHNNIVLLDKGSVQRKWPMGGSWRSAWYCWGQPCSAAYAFASNMYWRTDEDLTADQTAFFTTAQDGTATLMPFATWQAPAASGGQGEDAGSVIADPMFVDLAADDYHFRDPSVPAQIGFAVFDPSAAGAPASTARPPAVPATFPTHTLPHSAF